MALDLILHFAASWMLTDALEPLIGLHAAIMLTITAGIAKEVIWDWHMERGQQSAMDMVANFAGVAFACFWWSQWLLVSIVVFWWLYVFTMGLYRAFLLGRLKGLPLVLCAPVVFVAFVIDFLMQMTVFTLAFAELPRDWLVTHRLRRYMRDLPASHWRRRFADYLCHHLLDPFDPTGAHCDSDKPALKA